MDMTKELKFSGKRFEMVLILSLLFVVALLLLLLLLFLLFLVLEIPLQT